MAYGTPIHYSRKETSLYVQAAPQRVSRSHHHSRKVFSSTVYQCKNPQIFAGLFSGKINNKTLFCVLIIHKCKSIHRNNESFSKQTPWGGVRCFGSIVAQIFSFFFPPEKGNIPKRFSFFNIVFLSEIVVIPFLPSQMFKYLYKQQQQQLKRKEKTADDDDDGKWRASRGISIKMAAERRRRKIKDLSDPDGKSLSRQSLSLATWLVDAGVFVCPHCCCCSLILFNGLVNPLSPLFRVLF